MLKPHLKQHTRTQRDLWTCIGDVYISFKGYLKKKSIKIFHEEAPWKEHLFKLSLVLQPELTKVTGSIISGFHRS